MKVNQVRTTQNTSLFLLLKFYANAKVQFQLDPQLGSNPSPCSTLLTNLREKKVYEQTEWHILLINIDKPPGSPIGYVVNVATIDLTRSLNEEPCQRCLATRWGIQH